MIFDRQHVCLREARNERPKRLAQEAGAHATASRGGLGSTMQIRCAGLRDSHDALIFPRSSQHIEETTGNIAWSHWGCTPFPLGNLPTYTRSSTADTNDAARTTGEGTGEHFLTDTCQRELESFAF